MKIVNLILLLIMAFMCSCSSTGETAVREAIETCFSACQRGDLEMALRYVSPGEITQMQLAGDKRDKWIADMGEIAKGRLADATITIERIILSGDHAQAMVIVKTPAGEHVSTIQLNKSGDDWLLNTLPLIGG